MTATLPLSSVRLNTSVTSLQQVEGQWRVNGQPFASVMMAAPVHVARELLRDTDSRAAELMQIDASSAVVVAFGFNTHIALPQGFGFLVPPVPGANNSLLAATFIDQKSEGRAPEGGRLIRAFFGGESGARLLSADDPIVIALARTQLEAILGPLPDPTVTVVRRWPRSLPQYAVGHLERMAELDARVRALGGLWLLGNGYRGVGLPDLIRDARSAARQSLQGA